jgi:hypothetical protein
MSNTDNHPLVEFSKIISIAPNLNVMADIMNCPTNYEVFLTDVESGEQKTAIREYMNKCVDFMRHNIQGIMNNVNMYLRDK